MHSADCFNSFEMKNKKANIMKKLLSLFIVVFLFSSCVKNIGTGEPPYIITNQDYINDTISESDTLFLQLKLIKKNGAEFDKLVFKTSTNDTLIFSNSDMQNDNEVNIKYFPNLNLENDISMYYFYSIHSKNSNVIYNSGNFGLIIKAD